MRHTISPTIAYWVVSVKLYVIAIYFNFRLGVLNVLRPGAQLVHTNWLQQYGFSGMRNVEHQSPAYNAIVMVDGAPWQQFGSGYLNFNGIWVTRLSKPWAATTLLFKRRYGWTFLLTSKTGRGLINLLWRLNSATLETNVKYKRYNPVTQKTEEATDYYWNLSNSVPGQDFGKLDTRVSYV